LLDPLLVVAVYIYVFGIIFIGETLRRRGFSTGITRKLIHLFAGCSIILLPFFSHWIWPSLIPIGMLIVVVYAFTKLKESPLTTSMVEKGDVAAHAYGPAYYIASILIMVIAFWSKQVVAIMATFMMAWGDGSAAVVASKLKKRHVYLSDRSVEGSIAVFIFSLIGALFSSTIYNMITHTYPMSQLVTASLIGAVVATIVEALSIGPLRHFDNFTLPLITSAVLYTIL